MSVMGVFPESKRVLFVGSKNQGLCALRTMHRLAPDRLVGALTFDDTKDTRCVLDDFRAIAKELGIKLWVAKDRTHSETLMREIQPDLCFVVGWYWLISEDTLKSIPNGMICVHNSVLPRYRGGAPFVWGIINEEKELGFSLFSLTPGMDDGPVWASCAFPVTETDSIADVLAKMEVCLQDTFAKVYLPIVRGEMRPVPQDESQVTFAALRLPEDGEIDWTRPARYVYNFIRAQSRPYPGAFTWYKGKRLSIHKARLFPNTYYASPGQILQVGREEVVVACGDNRAVVVETVICDNHECPPARILKSLSIRLCDPRHKPPLYDEG